MTGHPLYFQTIGKDSCETVFRFRLYSLKQTERCCYKKAGSSLSNRWKYSSKLKTSVEILNNSFKLASADVSFIMP